MLRLLFFFCSFATAVQAAPAAPAVSTTPPAPAVSKVPPVAPPVVTPAFLDVVTFLVHTDDENHKLVVTSGPAQLRVDASDDHFSILYDSVTDHYTGLEHSNDTWWEFSWPEVRQAVETSKRYETHLQELSLEGINGTSAASTNEPASSLAPDDSSGYVWHQATDRKRIAGLDCVRWVGETVSGSSAEAWCFAGPVPKLQAAMERLRVINDPVELVPVRTLVPSLVFPIYDALLKGGVTPVLITWGGKEDSSFFTLVQARTRDYQESLFTVPKLYLKTTLVTMDGLIDQKK